MNYSKDLERRRRWFRINYTLIVLSVALGVLGLLVSDWNPVPAAQYASHSTDYLKVRQKLLAQPNLLTNIVWVRGGSQEAAVTLNDSQSVSGIRSYRLTATLDAAPNLNASLASSPVAVTGGTTYLYEDEYLATVENQLEIEEFNAAQVSTGRQYLSRYPLATTTSHFASHFTTRPDTVSIIIRRYIEATGKLTVESQRLRQSPVAGFSQGMVSIVFDDGLAGAYSSAAPEVQKNGFAATFYPIVDTIGQPGYITKDQLAALKNSGHEIASHTVSHRDLLGISADEKDKEISRSREALISMGLGGVQQFAAPFGKSDAETKTMVRRYYRSQRGLEDQIINYPYNYDPFAVKAVVVDNRTDPSRIASLVDQAKKSGGWLVLVYHDIAAEDSWAYRVAPEKFQQHLQTVKDSGITVVTMSAALDTADSFFKELP